MGITYVIYSAFENVAAIGPFTITIGPVQYWCGT